MNRNDLKIVCLLVGLFFATQAIAKDNKAKEHSAEMGEIQQQKEVTGLVTDEQGNPLPGAVVLETGTTNGISTDLNGKFTIKADASAQLTVSLLGFVSQTVAIDNRSVINVSLKENAQVLSEVVVTALGIKKEKKALSYSVASVPTDVILNSNTINVVSSLTGKVAGVSVNTTSSGNELYYIQQSSALGFGWYAV
jgi:hypothetical protein